MKYAAVNTRQYDQPGLMARRDHQRTCQRSCRNLLTEWLYVDRIKMTTQEGFLICVLSVVYQSPTEDLRACLYGAGTMGRIFYPEHKDSCRQ